MNLTQICKEALNADSHNLHRVIAAIGLVCAMRLAEGKNISKEAIEGEVLTLLSENDDESDDITYEERGPPR